MKKEKADLQGSENIDEILEFLKTARTLKRQVKLMRGIDLSDKEVEIIKTVLDEVKKEFVMFKVY